MSAVSNEGCACADGMDDVEAVVPDVMDCGESAGAPAELPVDERCCRNVGGAWAWFWVWLLPAPAVLLLSDVARVVERERGGVRSCTDRNTSCSGGESALAPFPCPLPLPLPFPALLVDWGVDVPETGTWNVNADCFSRTFSSCSVRSRLRRFSFSLDWPLFLASSSAIWSSS